MSETTAAAPAIDANKLKALKEDYEVRAVKIKMDKKTERFKPEIVLRNKAVNCEENFTDCSNFCSNDFVKAVLSLNGHMAIHIDRVEEEEFSSIKWDNETFKARGFSLSGAENELRVCLKGHIVTKRCGAIGQNANNIYLNEQVNEDDEKEPYEHLEDLVKKIKRIQEKALAYCFEKDYFEDPQLSLNLPEGAAATTANILAPASPEDVVKDIVNTANKRPAPQSADKPDGKTPRARKAR